MRIRLVTGKRREEEEKSRENMQMRCLHAYWKKVQLPWRQVERMYIYAADASEEARARKKTHRAAFLPLFRRAYALLRARFFSVALEWRAHDSQTADCSEDYTWARCIVELAPRMRGRFSREARTFIHKQTFSGRIREGDGKSSTKLGAAGYVIPKFCRDCYKGDAEIFERFILSANTVVYSRTN